MDKFAIKGMAIAAVFITTTVAEAQSSVTLYGIVDTGIDWENQVAGGPGQTAAGGSAIRMTSLSSALPSRWGLRGKEDLGNDVHAVFELENGFFPNTGALGNGNRLFGRSAWVGVETPVGTLKFGRQINFTYVGLLKSEVMGASTYSIGSLDPYLPNARSDNSVSYLASYRQFVLGATYSFGRDTASIPAANGGTSYSPGATNCPGQVAGDPVACRQITALVGYWGDQAGGQFIYDELRGGPGGLQGNVPFDPSSPVPLPTSSAKTTRFMGSGYAKFGNLEIQGGAIHRRTRTLSVYETNIFFGGVSYLLRFVLLLEGEIARISTIDHKNSNFYIFRTSYILSKRTSLYSMLAFMQNNSNASYSVGAGNFATRGAKQVGVLFGIQHRF
ncbi:gram-negative porin family protein [Burkholderia cenocepacia]|uniref:Gram-negative porin family protein n=1 Tax=Burkholderia cenocepacia TaxID=95486 RepID=A0AAN0RZQ2_9BURK|nr:gram-negative porin family protein [Burkholderia cenocepacia]